MKAKYAHLIKPGKPAKVALTAIMRKLVVLVNALLKAQSHLTPNRLINTDTLAAADVFARVASVLSPSCEPPSSCHH